MKSFLRIAVVLIIAGLATPGGNSFAPEESKAPHETYRVNQMEDGVVIYGGPGLDAFIKERLPELALVVGADHHPLMK